MKIGIISSSSKLYSTRRLKEAAQARGHQVRIFPPAYFTIHVDEREPSIYFKGKPVSKLNAIIPRVSGSRSFYGTAVVRQFEQMGVFCLNPSRAMTVAHDKLRTMQILSRHNFGIPASACVFDSSGISEAISRVGNAPVVIKLLHGSQGSGVMLAESNKVAEAIVQALNAAEKNVLIQRFVAESKGRDIRAFVVGDRVVAAMRRIATGEEFRSNVHLGGTAEAVQLDPAYAIAAVHSAHIIGLRVAGVDILETNDGPKIMEVNSSPGLEGIELYTGVNVADAIIELLETEVLFPDVDLQHRLSLGRGYSVVEIPVSRKSALANCTIDEARLAEQEVQVLSIIRQGHPMPTPASHEKMLPGDVLICFGKQMTLKALIPVRSKRAKNTVTESIE